MPIETIAIEVIKARPRVLHRFSDKPYRVVVLRLPSRGRKPSSGVQKCSPRPGEAEFVTHEALKRDLVIE